MNILAPKTINEALEIFEREQNARPLAGATDLLLQMRARRIQTNLLVDLSKVGIEGVSHQNGVTIIGAMTRLSDINFSIVIQKSYPLLIKAISQFATKQIRNMATIGGNIGNASPAADLATPLLVYDAIVTLKSKQGERKIPISEYFVGPGKSCRNPNEIITEIQFENPNKHSETKFNNNYFKVGARRGSAISIVAGSVLIHNEGKKIISSKIALGAVAPTPKRCANIEAVLSGGKEISPKLITEAINALDSDISPISDVRASMNYRKIVAKNMIKNILEQIC